MRRSYSLTINDRLIGSSNWDNPPQIKAVISNIYGGSLVIAKIEIFNLSKNYRDGITDEREQTVKLKAEDCIVFSGKIVNASTQTPNRTDNVLELLCNSAPESVNAKVAPKSYPKGTALKAVLKDILKPINKNVLFRGLFNQKLGSSLTVSGDLERTLQNIGKMYNFTHKININDCVIIDNNYSDSAIIDLGLANEFLGGTTLTDAGCNIRCNLKPFIYPFNKVKVDALNPRLDYAGAYVREVTVRQGIYKVISIVHSLDFYGAAWETELQCVRT